MHFMNINLSSKNILSPLVLLLIVSFIINNCMAVEPDEILDNPELENRARIISSKLRCQVCQNQSIDDSNADLAKSLRVVLRKRLLAGDSDQEIIKFMVDRYGEGILLTPPFSSKHMILWLSPILFLFCGIIYIIVAYKRNNKKKEKPLSSEEKTRLKDIISK